MELKYPLINIELNQDLENQSEPNQVKYGRGIYTSEKLLVQQNQKQWVEHGEPEHGPASRSAKGPNVLFLYSFQLEMLNKQEVLGDVANIVWISRLLQCDWVNFSEKPCVTLTGYP